MLSTIFNASFFIQFRFVDSVACISQKETYDYLFIQMFMQHHNTTFRLTNFAMLHFDAVLQYRSLKLSNRVTCPLYRLYIFDK